MVVLLIKRIPFVRLVVGGIWTECLVRPIVWLVEQARRRAASHGGQPPTIHLYLPAWTPSDRLREVYAMPKDAIPELLIRRMVHQFEESIAQLPIETDFDEQRNVYKARLDLWVKPISNHTRADKEG